MKQPIGEDVFPMFVRALAFASRKHINQRRKDADASPYINHPIALVYNLVDEAGIHDMDVLCAALLHDTLEDTETTAAELALAFGGTITGIVIEVTDDKTLAKEERKRLQIEHALRLSPAARLVKVADKIANLRDVADNPPANWSVQRRQEYFDWAKEVVDAMSDLPPPLRKLFDDAHACRPTIAELSKAAGFKEDKQPGIGITITGVPPPKQSKKNTDGDA